MNYDIITKENMIYKDDDYPPSTVTVNGVSFYKVHIGEEKKEKKKLLFLLRRPATLRSVYQQLLCPKGKYLGSGLHHVLPQPLL